jgi:hypothetical protein
MSGAPTGGWSSAQRSVTLLAMTLPQRESVGVLFARPLAFTLIMVYGLSSFLLGYQDWHHLKRLPGLSQIVLVAGGLLLGSAAIRVIFRRHKAFGRAALALGLLFVADLAGPMVPGVQEDWRYPAVRLGLSLLILWLLRITDAAVAPRQES